MDTSTRSENQENYGLGATVKSKSYLPQMKQNTSTELLGHAFLKIYSKNGSPDPKSGFFPDFPRFFIGIRFSSYT